MARRLNLRGSKKASMSKKGSECRKKVQNVKKGVECRKKDFTMCENLVVMKTLAIIC